MAKTYWIGTYRSISNPEKLAAYAVLAGPAIAAGGGKFVVRGTPAKTYEAGLNQRTVVVEFDSLEQAVAAHDSPAYQAALAALGDKYPALTQRLFENGQVRRFVNVYVNNEDIRYLDNLATALKDGDEVAIIPAVAGG